MKIKAIGFDLAKNVFQVHGVDETGRPILCKRLRRSQVMEFFARLEPCLVGMEACAGAHHWARQLKKLGHDVRLISPQFVKRFVTGNKNDKRDAEAICEALLHRVTRFVPVKTEEQQAVLSLHRMREGYVQSRTALVNRMRGLLAEFGEVVPKGRRTFEEALPRLLQEGQAIPELLRPVLLQARGELAKLNDQIASIEARLRSWHRTNEASRRLEEIPGVGMMTATAAVATLGGNAKLFDRGRQFAAWVGLTPREHSSGEKRLLLGITKHGDSYLRKLLVHGARAVVSKHRPEKNAWLTALLKRRPRNVATVALAQRNARVLWAMLAYGTNYQPKGTLILN
jgi:transposase